MQIRSMREGSRLPRGAPCPRVTRGNIMKHKRILRMVGIRKGGVAIIAVQYEDGEVMQYIFDREGRVA